MACLAPLLADDGIPVFMLWMVRRGWSKGPRWEEKEEERLLLLNVVEEMLCTALTLTNTPGWSV